MFAKGRQKTKDTSFYDNEGTESLLFGSTIYTSWYRRYGFSSYYGVSIDKKGN
jgi:hypothetical protein